MATLTPVDGDPFATTDTPPAQPSTGSVLTPVDHDPFAPTAPVDDQTTAILGHQYQGPGPTTVSAGDSYNYPRWSPLQDIKHEYNQGADATRSAIQGTEATIQNTHIDPISKLATVATIPLTALSALTAPITGLIHGTLGSALSYLAPGTTPEEKKKNADSETDKLMLAIAPEEAASLSATRAGSVFYRPSQLADEGQAMREARVQASKTNAAIDRINTRATQDKLDPNEIKAKQNAATAAGDQMTLLDLGGRNTKGLGGSVYRSTGEGSSDIQDFLNDRTIAAKDDLKSKVQGIAKGSTFDTINQLYDGTRAASKPLWDKALDGGSIAPLENQFEGYFNDASKAVSDAIQQLRQAQNEQTVLEGRNVTQGNNVYSTPTPDDLRAAQKKVDAAQNAVDAANAQKESIKGILNKAQEDGTSNAKGAIWSPRLDQFQDDPIVRGNMGKALLQEKRAAIAENRPFNDADYAITGYDENGEPTIGRVPTMKTWAVAKEGLDAKINSADYRDPITGRPNKAGQNLIKFRDALVDELDKLNPDYKPARDAWSGPSNSAQAVRDGLDHFNRRDSDAQVQSEYNALSPGDKEFYKLGATESKLDAMKRPGPNKATKLVNSDNDIYRWQMMFDNNDDANNFLDAVQRKADQFKTKQAIMGGSPTAQRIEDDSENGLSPLLNAAGSAGKAAVQAKTGNLLGAAKTGIKGIQEWRSLKNPDISAEMSKIFTNPSLDVNTSGTGPLLNRVKPEDIFNQTQSALGGNP